MWKSLTGFLRCTRVYSYGKLRGATATFKQLYGNICYNKKVSCRDLSKNPINANIYWQRVLLLSGMESFIYGPSTNQERWLWARRWTREGWDPGEPPKQGGRHFLYHLDYYGSCVSAKQNTSYYTNPSMKFVCKRFGRHVAPEGSIIDEEIDHGRSLGPSGFSSKTEYRV